MSWFTNLPAVVKKLIAAVVTMLVTFLVLWLLKAFISVLIFQVLLSIAAGLVVWFKVAAWEIDKVVKQAQDTAQNVAKKV